MSSPAISASATTQLVVPPTPMLPSRSIGLYRTASTYRDPIIFKRYNDCLQIAHEALHQNSLSETSRERLTDNLSQLAEGLLIRSDIVELFKKAIAQNVAIGTLLTSP